jgi:hypothetical protein
MSEARRTRPVPVGLLVNTPARPRPTNLSEAGGSAAGPRPRNRWLWTVLGAAGLYPLFLVSAGLLVTALRPVPQTVTETTYTPPVVAVEDEEWWPAEVEAVVQATRVEPGEARALSTDVPVAPPEPTAPEPAGPTRPERLGTAIDFVRSPAVAFDRAARERKLVMVLHLAGNFEDCGFT